MRLIDADKLLRNTVYNTLCAPYITKRDVEEAPTVDAAPVVHGHWKTRKSWDRYVCTECSFEAYGTTNYCPHCGAKMDGGENDAR